MKDTEVARFCPVLSARFCLTPPLAPGTPTQFISTRCVCLDGRWVTSQGTTPLQEAGHSEGGDEG